MHCNLLLVDDEPNIPRALRRSLRNEGYHFLIAGSADEAFDLLRATPVDVVISDHRMPGVTGAEFLSEVSKHYPDTVRLMLSGQADIDAVIDAINEGNIYKFLTKPWDNERLRNTVRSAADKARARHIDPHTGWQTHDLFAERVRVLAEERPLRIVTCEIRNIATVWALLSEPQRLALAGKIEQRCIAATGEPLIPHAALDRGLFAFALPAGEPDDLISGVVERLTSPLVIDGQALTLQAALGYVDSDQVADITPEALIKNAIVALAGVGVNGRGFAHYQSKSSGDLRLHQTLEHDLQSAIARSQFFFQLQPQVSTKTMCISGAEALIRWRHPDHGLISPAQFIDMAEKNGFINEIGVWVVCSTMQHLETLQDLGINDVRVSLNVSPRQFSGGTTAAWVTVLRQYATEQPELMEHLEIEVTESTIMDDPETAMEILREFKALGIRIALDDFGMGYSSLSYLQTYPVDKIKIDREFVSQLPHSPETRAIVIAITDLGHALGMTVTGEGAETDIQRRILRECDVDSLQGYVDGRPMDEGEATALVRKTALVRNSIGRKDIA